MSLSSFETAALLVGQLPPGAASLYDLSSTGDPYRYFASLADLLKQEGFDVVDLVRAEANPSTATQKVPDWETALGLADTIIAKYGTMVARQAQVISKLRESGNSCAANVQAVIGPLVGYANPSLLGIIETTRSALTTLHTYANASGGSIPAGGNLGQRVTVADDGLTSLAGALVSVAVSAANAQNLSLDLVGPYAVGSQARLHWNAGCLGSGAVNATIYLWASGAAGAPIMGDWWLTITNAGGSPETLTSWSLFVEGIGHDAAGNNGLGAAIYRFAVLVDPALTSSPNYPAVLRALRRIEPAHAHGDYALKMSGGGSYAVVDDVDAIIDSCLCAS